jgi:hypothetical protein
MTESVLFHAWETHHFVPPTFGSFVVYMKQLVTSTKVLSKLSSASYSLHIIYPSYTDADTYSFFSRFQSGCYHIYSIMLRSNGVPLSSLSVAYSITVAFQRHLDPLPGVS